MCIRDRHCHWVFGIDDGAKTPDESIAMLRGLWEIGFSHVVATPHMRPGMFDNDRADLVSAFERTRERIAGVAGLPEVSLGSEHFFDDVVFQRIAQHASPGEGAASALPYSGGKSVLVELPIAAFPLRLAHRFADLARRGLRPVLAHPERYEPVWDDTGVLDELIDVGAMMLLDVAALAGKYGKQPRKCAERLLGDGYYHAACSDAHRPDDVEAVADGMAALEKRAGKDEAAFLLGEGPRGILEGRFH